MDHPICLIDDDDLFRLNLADELRALGHGVDEASTARAGEALLTRQSYRTVVVDVLMPVMDGIELIEKIRARWPLLRIIAISGGGRIAAELCLELAEQMGADAFIRKPLHGRDIVSRINCGLLGSPTQA